MLPANEEPDRLDANLPKELETVAEHLLESNVLGISIERIQRMT